MQNIIYIDSLDLPGLQPYRTMRRAVEHVKQGIFVAESEKVVRKLLASNITIISMLMTPQWYENLFPNDNQLLQYSEGHRISSTQFTVYIAEKSLLESIVGFDLHQGIMAVAKIPKQLLIDDVVKQSLQPYLFVALDGLTNADNLGVIVRNCVAFGATGLIVGETSSSPYLRRAIRQSMGSVFDLPVIHVFDLAATLKLSSDKYKIQTIAADAHANVVSVDEANLKENICIVLGSEASGIRKNVLDACTEKVTIPISDKIDSLNVASASAVFLYEANKQR
jgi:tRNA G18 (ribose-2'-O)-methylase SpoU